MIFGAKNRSNFWIRLSFLYLYIVFVSCMVFSLIIVRLMHVFALNMARNVLVDIWHQMKPKATQLVTSNKNKWPTFGCMALGLL